ncbi:MAG: hypothetical protein EZS28_016696 [Streblomastix strix]|uniref:Uncharacterized protein n=1 Tax=Streblomastix strix TaxID=222440 RepID=A0A5J4VZF1_9EUKA|nr:MAG: hypothetical protein EZS28_016696 [Streblomastix strix]
MFTPRSQPPDAFAAYPKPVLCKEFTIGFIGVYQPMSVPIQKLFTLTGCWYAFLCPLPADTVFNLMPSIQVSVAFAVYAAFNTFFLDSSPSNSLKPAFQDKIAFVPGGATAISLLYFESTVTNLAILCVVSKAFITISYLFAIRASMPAVHCFQIPTAKIDVSLSLRMYKKCQPISQQLQNSEQLSSQVVHDLSASFLSPASFFRFLGSASCIYRPQYEFKTSVVNSLQCFNKALSSGVNFVPLKLASHELSVSSF